MPVGALITGILLDAVGGTVTLTLMGALLVVSAAGFSLLPNVRNARAVTARPSP
jgi:predicted MFS family arabinose efflux permease